MTDAHDLILNLGNGRIPTDHETEEPMPGKKNAKHRTAKNLGKHRRKRSPLVRPTKRKAKRSTSPKRRAQSPHPSSIGSATAFPNGARKRVGYGMVEPGDLLKIRDKKFERLCWSVVLYEVARRHAGAELDGPPRPYVKDGGADLVLHVKSVPRLDSAASPHSLTRDSIGDQLFSAKTGDSHKNIVKQVLKDAKNQALPLEILERGGTYTVLISSAITVNERKSLHASVVAALTTRSTKIVACATRVFVHDATHILQHLQQFGPTLPGDILSDLGIKEFDDLDTLDEWARYLQDARPDPPQIVLDPQRRNAVDIIRGFPDGVGPQRPLRVFGPPGIGKSRLVIEALQGSDAQDRVRVARIPRHADAAIAAGLLEHQKDVCLVVDECSGLDSITLVPAFTSKASDPRARLIMIGLPAVEASAPNLLEVPIGPLAREQAEHLVGSILQTSNVLAPETKGQLAARVVDLCEGFPWFCILVAREVALHAEILPPTADQAYAARLALAGPRHDGESEIGWIERSGTLLRVVTAITLSEGEDWDKKPVRLDIEEISGIDIDLLLQRTRELSKRGIVRLNERLGLRYVAPGIVARISMSVCLREYRLAQRVGTRRRELRARLLSSAQKLELSDDELAEVVESELSAIRDGPPGIEGVSATAGARLVDLAKIDPRKTAEVLRRKIEESDLDVLRREREIRRDVVWALEHVTRRKQGFEDAESGLFRLALAENESYGNSATGIWCSLFTVSRSMTHRSFDERVSILETRLSAPDREGRLLALRGLSNAAGSDRVGPSFSDYDRADGEWLGPRTHEEMITFYARAWEQLVRMSLDSSEEVARVAREAIVNKVEFATRWSRGTALDSLHEIASSWTMAEKARLRDALARCLEFDREALEKFPGARGAVESLFRRVAPTSLHDRFIDQLGRWSLRGSRELRRDGRLPEDMELARDVLKMPDELEAELPWLDSSDAQRAPTFMRALGEADRELSLLPVLIRHVQKTKMVDALACYVSGVHIAIGNSGTDAIIRSWRANPALALATAIAVWRIGLTPERVGWIVDDLRAGRVGPSNLSCLQRGNWSGPNPQSVVSLVEALVEARQKDGYWIAVGLGLQIVKNDVTLGSRVRGVLQPAVETLVPPEDDVDRRLLWHELAAFYIDEGVWMPFLLAALESIRTAKQFRLHDEEWNVVRKILWKHPIDSWPLVAACFVSPGMEAYRIRLEAGHHSVTLAVPAKVMAEWVGDSDQRSLAVAETLPAHEAPLNDHARILLQRFGSNSDIARILTATALSTPHAVSDMAAFYHEQLERARGWSSDSYPSVAAWGRSLIATLQGALEREEVRRELREREMF